MLLATKSTSSDQLAAPWRPGSSPSACGPMQAVSLLLHVFQLDSCSFTNSTLKKNRVVRTPKRSALKTLVFFFYEGMFGTKEYKTEKRKKVEE